MARINVEQVALTDSRFKMLARLLGLADSDHAIGKMLHVWNACQERGRYTLKRDLVDAIFNHDDASEMLVQSQLAVTAPRGSIRIKGTRGRTDWLKKRREDGKRGGRPRNPRVIHSEPKTCPSDNPLTPALTLALKNQNKTPLSPVTSNQDTEPHQAGVGPPTPVGGSDTIPSTTGKSEDPEGAVVHVLETAQRRSNRLRRGNPTPESKLMADRTIFWKNRGSKQAQADAFKELYDQETGQLRPEWARQV